MFGDLRILLGKLTQGLNDLVADTGIKRNFVALLQADRNGARTQPDEFADKI